MSTPTTTPDAATPAPAAPTPVEHLFQLTLGYMASSALQVAARLKIADHLAASPRAVEELATAAGTNADALYRVLRALAGLGVFEEVAPRRFSLNAAADLLRTDNPHGLQPMVLWLTDPFHFKLYAETLYSVQTGRPAIEKTHGVQAFELFARDRELSAVFNDAMTTFSGMVIPAVLDTYDFSDAGLIVDVAGGHGGVLTAILQRHPHLHGILFDLEHVIAGAKPRIAALGLEARCRTEAGDFFTAVPAGDTYVLKSITHDWDDEKAGLILRNIRTAMREPSAGRVILIESVIRPGNSPDLAKLIDLEMLVGPGGKERTADEFGALFDAAGFELTRIVPNQSPLCAIEARVRA